MKKTCIECKQELPETSFHRSADGRMHPKCKTCRSSYERKRRKKKKDSRLDAIEQDAVDVFCKAARLGGSTIPHSAELIEVLLEYFGGVRGFGNVFMKQYYDSPPGGAHRTKMLETLVRLVNANTAMGGAKKPLSVWTEDELEEELRQRLMETAITLKALPVSRAVEVLSETAPAEDPGPS
ncbi:hypothetical protein EBZ80_26650 [bacterium]|jgi:hypothetical protein|nr:hypothetical protein [bacterium]